jgi:PKD repeat protein
MSRSYDSYQPAVLSSLHLQQAMCAFLLMLLFTLRAVAGQATLAWDPSTDPKVTGYMLYYGQASGSYTTAVDVGNVTTYTVFNLTEGRTYYYAVKARDAAGIESAFSNQVSGTIPFPPPVSNFNVNATTGVAPATVTFTSTATGQITSYSWSFGDGTSSTATNPSHTYAAAGTYSVSLTVAGPGGTNTATKTNLIRVSAAAPVAGFTASTASGSAPLTIQFTSTSTGTISSYAWNFGNGITSAAQTPPAVTYTTAGSYPATLTVTGPGGTNTKTATITVTAPIATNQPPNGTISAPAAPITITEGESVTFQGSGADPDNNTPLVYAWDFGGGAPASSNQNPTVRFALAGTYAVRLTVIDAKGLADQTPASTTVVVAPAQAPAPPAPSPAPTPAPVGTPLAATDPPLSAVLPLSRAARVGATVTAFATVINAGATTASGCGIALASALPAILGYQTTDARTNALTGSPNTPADIGPGAAQSYVFSLTPSAAFGATDVQLRFSCANANPATVLTGINTLLLSASNTPTADVIALAATASGNGIVDVPGSSGTGAFAVASANVGSAASITVSADTGAASVPVALTLCQTNPASGACLAPPAASLSTAIAAGATPTFAVFATARGTIPFNPAANRIFLRFRDNASGQVVGATSVALRTQ